MIAETEYLRCNECGIHTIHSVVFKERPEWENTEHGAYGWRCNEVLKCGGCSDVRLRIEVWESSEFDEPRNIKVFPPDEFRKYPNWIGWMKMRIERPELEPVWNLHRDVYTAMQYELWSLAIMGVRALWERVMILTCGDHLSITDNLDAFAVKVDLAPQDKAQLKMVLEVGNAVTHRGFVPSEADLLPPIETTERLLKKLYGDSKPDLLADLHARIPPKAKRTKQS